jgi:hypothetical protein
MWEEGLYVTTDPLVLSPFSRLSRELGQGSDLDIVWGLERGGHALKSTLNLAGFKYIWVAGQQCLSPRHLGTWSQFGGQFQITEYHEQVIYDGTLCAVQVHTVHNGDAACWLGTIADVHQSQYQWGGESDTDKGLEGHHSGKMIRSSVINCWVFLLVLFLSLMSYICHPRFKNLLLFLVGHDILHPWRG